MFTCNVNPLDAGAVGDRWRLGFAANSLNIVRRRSPVALALEHLLVCLPEIFREESVDDWVDRGVAVGQAVCNDAEHKRRLVQRERAELHPQMDDVMREPGKAEHHYDYQHRLGCLKKTETQEVNIKATLSVFILPLNC